MPIAMVLGALVEALPCILFLRRVSTGALGIAIFVCPNATKDAGSDSEPATPDVWIATLFRFRA